MPDHTWPVEHATPAWMPVGGPQRHEKRSENVMIRKLLPGLPAVTRRAGIDVRRHLQLAACEAVNTCTYGTIRQVPHESADTALHALQVNPT